MTEMKPLKPLLVRKGLMNFQKLLILFIHNFDNYSHFDKNQKFNRNSSSFINMILRKGFGIFNAKKKYRKNRNLKRNTVFNKKGHS